jgi:ABC-type nitrate/sulfonate/bicarbonate transport system substrate-binding protein
MDQPDGHMSLNIWLFLRKNGLEDGKNVQMIEGDRKPIERVRAVMAGVYDATFVSMTEGARAQKLGANVIEVARMPMIEGVTATTTTTYVNNHPEEVESLLKAMVDAIHFFKTNKKDTIDLINKTCRDVLRVQSDEELDAFYESRAQEFQRKPYPNMDAIQNVFQLGLKIRPEIKDFNPLIMWDMHHLRAIDDSGYIDKLYQ